MCCITPDICVAMRVLSSLQAVLLYNIISKKMYDLSLVYKPPERQPKKID